MSPVSSLGKGPREEGPRESTLRRLALHREAVASATVLDQRYASLRLLAFAAAIVVVFFALRGQVPWGLALVPALVFVGLLVFHGRVRNRRRRAERLGRLYERSLARIEDRWTEGGATGASLRPEDHVYADDLDLFGPGSLFQLLSTARTEVGEACLARWLLEPATLEEIVSRQEAVEALRPRLDLREDLALAGEEVASALDRHAAETWALAPRRLGGRVYPLAVRLLGLVTTGLCVAWAFGALPFAPFGASALLLFLLTLPVGRQVARVLSEADRPSQDLALVSRLLERFEEESFKAGRLGELGRKLEEGGASPAARIRSLMRLIDFVDARRNQIFLPLSWVLGLGTQLAYGIEAWRAAHGPSLVTWLEALGELEALVSISTYAYEHPEDPFPTFLEGEARFEAKGLGHPLIPAADNVRNDVALAASEGASPVVQALLVSGSNMSGKSTWLRSVGVATVMALAGCPVRARALSLSRLHVGSSIRINDSILSGASRFYAEIQRLKQVVDLARDQAPALFLLDEMLGGTNSHDRRIGADAVIHTLLDRGALGLVSTHDLALATIAKADPRMKNVHFEDRLEEGKMLFDYRIRDGVVQHSNAIALMRAVGLDVKDVDVPGGTP